MSEEAQEAKDGLPENCPRRYRMGQRAAAMDESRARIVASARELILGKNALTGFSMEAVARQAGVTRVTVYNRFSSRRGLLEALLDEVGARGSLHQRLPEVFSHPEAPDALQAYVEVFCEFWDGDRAIHRRLRAFAQLDAEFAEAMASRYGHHRHAIESLLRRLDADNSTPASQMLEEQVTTVLALTGFEFYDALAGARTPQEVAPQIYRLLLAALKLAAHT